MTRRTSTLEGARVLILEDDFYLATDLQRALEAAGASVVGPFPDEPDARRALEANLPDCAFVDVNLGSGPSFDMPRELLRREIPFAFVTGYDASTIPIEFKAVERFEKPIEPQSVAGVAARLLGRAEVTPR